MKPQPIILAIDFDNTISLTNWPNITRLRHGAKYFINKLYSKGYYIIIWTCRHEEYEAAAYSYLENKGVKFHSINSQHPQLIEAFQNDTRKISADIYIDDKGLWLFKLPHWIVLYYLIRFKSLFLTSIFSQFIKK